MKKKKEIKIKSYEGIELKLASGLIIECNRLCYHDEGLRLIIFDTKPYNFHIELQLSKKDCSLLIDLLKINYNEQKDNNWR